MRDQQGATGVEGTLAVFVAIFAGAMTIVHERCVEDGNAITVSSQVWQAMLPPVLKGNVGNPFNQPIGAEWLKPVVEEYMLHEVPFKLGMVSPVSAHNHEFRYWMAARGNHPGFHADAMDAKACVGWIDGDVRISVTPPPPSVQIAGTRQICG